MTILIADHACERYISRIAKKLSFDEARDELQQAFAKATPLKKRSSEGHVLYEAMVPRRCTLIVKPDEFGPGFVLVTVIPARELHESVEELQSYLKDRSEDQRRWQEELDSRQRTDPDVQHKMLTTELAILREEVALAKAKLHVQKEATQEKYGGKTQALRWAIRGLRGEVTVPEAMERIRDVGVYFLGQEFLEVEFEK